MKFLRYMLLLLVTLLITACASREAEKTSSEGYELYMQGSYDEAIQLLSEGIEKYPDYADLYTNRAMAYFESGDAEAAMEDLSRSLEIEADNPEAYSNRGYIELAYGEYQLAIADFYQAIELRGFFEQEDGLYYTYLNLGTALNQIDQHAEALLVYERALEIHPEDPELLNAVGLAKRTAGDLEGALETLNKAIELDQHYAYAYINRAGIYLAMGNLEKGLADALTGMDLDPSIPQAYSLIGQIYQALEENELALDVLSSGIRKWGSYPELYLQRGDLYYGEGQFDKAILDFSLARDLGNAEGYFGMGLCYIEMQQYEEAMDSLASYEAAGATGRADVLYLKALAFEGIKDYVKAASLLEEALQLNPGLEEAKIELDFIKENFLQ